MKISKLAYSATGAFSGLIADYLAKDSKLSLFYNRFPEISAFKAQIQEKQFPADKREKLCRVLQEQYKTIGDIHPEAQKSLDLLSKPTTYTVTTGHQLNIFTGPLYFIYKIITTINLARQLKEAYPDYDFVPVYWMATEDHDFAEINHFSLFGKTYTWESGQKGAVGRFSISDMEVLLQELPEQFSLFAQAYTQHSSLADATRAITHSLFGKYGLISIDADNASLKAELAPVIREDLFNQTSHKLVSKASESLAEFYKPQVMSREINLFYLDEQVRERIVLENENYKVLNTHLSFTRAELEQLITDSPEKFSPNVILRPLYQEMILPNLAYIGGGAEVAYWFQLKPIFETFQVPYPIIMLRNSALYISKPNANRMHKLELTAEDLFKDIQTLKRQITSRLEDQAINLEEEKKQIEAIFEQIAQLASKVDGTLTKTVAAEGQKTQNAIAVLEKKLIKANDTKYETYFNQLSNLKDKLFPNGSLQERTDNLLTYQANNPDFIPALVAAFDPLDGMFTVLEEE